MLFLLHWITACGFFFFLRPVVFIWRSRHIRAKGTTELRQKESESAKSKNALQARESSPAPQSLVGLVVLRRSCAEKTEGRAHCMAGDTILPGSPSSPGSQAASSGSAGRSVCGVRSGRCAVLQLEVLFSRDFRISGHLRRNGSERERIKWWQWRGRRHLRLPLGKKPEGPSQSLEPVLSSFAGPCVPRRWARPGSLLSKRRVCGCTCRRSASILVWRP